jgi:hypothetical protein
VANRFTASGHGEVRMSSGSTDVLLDVLTLALGCRRCDPSIQPAQVPAAFLRLQEDLRRLEPFA